MPFETVHQTLKQSITRKPHTDKHISWVYHTMPTDWQRRIIQQLNIISISSEDIKLNMKHISLGLLLGKDAINLRKNGDGEIRMVGKVFCNISRI